jgi:hypothetical protein
MRARCEACGTWVDEAYTHIDIVNGQCLCVLCAFQTMAPNLWQERENQEA